VHTKHDDTDLDFRTLQELADNFLSIGDLDKAEIYYEKAARIDADHAVPYVGIGTIALRKNIPDEAQLAFRVACRLDPNCSQAYEGLGKIAQQNEKHEIAIEMYLKCLELDANNLSALLGLFQASSQMGSFAKIIHYLQIYLNMHPDDIAVMFSLATLYIKENQYQKSKKMLLNILAICPDNNDAQNLLEEVQQNLACPIST